VLGGPPPGDDLGAGTQASSSAVVAEDLTAETFIAAVAALMPSARPARAVARRAESPPQGPVDGIACEAPSSA
jgi:hypothetical protein